MTSQSGYTKNKAGRHLFQLTEGSMIILHKYRTYGIFFKIVFRTLFVRKHAIKIKEAPFYDLICDRSHKQWNFFGPFKECIFCSVKIQNLDLPYCNQNINMLESKKW